MPIVKRSSSFQLFIMLYALTTLRDIFVDALYKSTFYLPIPYLSLDIYADD